MALQTDTAPATKPLTAKRKLATSRVLATVLFTVVEAWALVVVLAHIRAGGIDRIALALALAGCVVAVVDAWQNIRAQRSTNAESPSEER